MIKFVARANLHQLGQFLAGKRADGPQEALQILDIVLRELSMRRYDYYCYLATYKKPIHLPYWHLCKMIKSF